MESQSYFHDIRVSPKKLRFLVPHVKRLTPIQSLDYLLYAPYKTARILYKAVQSAIANATNTLKLSADMLQFKLLTIEEGPDLKRFRSGSRGGVKPVKRRFSHIRIVLVGTQTPKTKEETKTPVAEAKPTAPKKSPPPVKKTPTKKTVAKKTVKKESTKKTT